MILMSVGQEDAIQVFNSLDPQEPCDENFIRCSTMIAELLMKYKSMETEEDQEGWMQEEASIPLFFAAAIEKISVIVYTV